VAGFEVPERSGDLFTGESSKIFIADAIDDALCEGTGKEQSRVSGIDAPGLEKEERVGIQLADRRSVARTDVIGVDFELGLCVDMGVIREKQIRVRLTCIRFLCTRTDDDASAKNTSRMIAEHPAILLVTRALLCGVVDGREVVGS